MGAIIGTIFVAIFGGFGVGFTIPTLAFVTLGFALFFAFFGGMVGAFVVSVRQIFLNP